MELYLPAQDVLKKYVRFSAIDQSGEAHEITDHVATQCGYTITYDDWGSISFRSSLYSCYTQIRNDTYYTQSVKIEMASSRGMGDAVTYVKMVTCPYIWSPREIICERNYMEVSVRRKIPVISEEAFRSEPEDWSTAFTQAVSGFMSVWQVVFHLSTTQKTTMLIDAAQDIGYGINTTESRILLRAPYNASQAVLQRTGGVSFSTLRATLFYKQHWFIYLVDNAVACPVEDVKFMSGWIVWTVPKSISPLLTGAKVIKSSQIQFGVDLRNLTDAEIRYRKYEVVDSNTETTARIPYGAAGGYYKSRVLNFQHGVTYNIRPFLENVWVDDSWGITKYTIIKDIVTPFQAQPPIIINETIPSTQIFNVTVGTFLPDVQLVSLTVGDAILTIPQGLNMGYTIQNLTQTNGTLIYILHVPFSDVHVSTETFPDGILFTLNVTFGFTIIPNGENFTTSGTIECFIPQPYVGPCEQSGSTLSIALGNLDPSLRVFIKNVQATPNSGLLSTNQTHSVVQVPVASGLVANEVTATGLSITIPITIRDRTGNMIHDAIISCDAPPSPVECLPDGTMKVSVKRISNIPNMDLTKLRLRDSSCGPDAIDGDMANFTFTVNSCRTTRIFQGNLMIYENAISYVSSVTGKALYIMNVICNYTTNSTLVVDYSYQDNPTPSAQTGNAPLGLVLKLSESDEFSVFYGDAEYPVVKFLQDPLYFEVELLYSTDPQLELFLDSCWATTTPDMASLPMWPIIDNSCEHSEPYKTIFHPVMADQRVQFPSHLKRFEVKTFTFMEEAAAYTGEIYFHCDVIICDSSNLASDPTCTQIGSCIPARQRTGRSLDTDGNRQRLVSSRAVFLLGSKMRADKQIQNHPQ
ncbi:zona pellucida sperm-binding protein 2-like isoform X2 [Hyla sarda]|nr:zona pellucida sperm-binding protein 2-like isoform X2 [Hyla sarda]XP_056419066.1 zona pellucida sperm-binding protein 2-like isoform X2 [Hyla sarda]XP_056419067.1 zona pellucida sperm-binding protein 2-like isoform X2 [Hyla sarda]